MARRDRTGMQQLIERYCPRIPGFFSGLALSAFERIAADYPLPPYLQRHRTALLQHPAMQWVAGIYRLHRGSSSAV